MYLLYKIVSYYEKKEALFCPKHKVSITIKVIELSIVGKLPIGLLVVLGNLFLKVKLWDGFRA